MSSVFPQKFQAGHAIGSSLLAVCRGIDTTSRNTYFFSLAYIYFFVLRYSLRSFHGDYYFVLEGLEEFWVLDFHLQTYICISFYERRTPVEGLVLCQRVPL